MFSLALFFFVLFFVFVNYIQSTVGLYPKLAQKYSTRLVTEKTKVTKLTEIYLVKISEYNTSNKDLEYRPWLSIKPNETGLYIGQVKSLILLFPKNCFIPWEEIKFIEKQSSIFKDKYVFEVNLNGENIYLITKIDILSDKKQK